MCMGGGSAPKPPKLPDPPPLPPPKVEAPPPPPPTPPPEPLVAVEEVAPVEYGGKTNRKNRNTAMGTSQLKIPTGNTGTGGINIG